MLQTLLIAATLLSADTTPSEEMATVAVPLTFAIDDTWKDVARPAKRHADGTRTWQHRRTKGLLTFRMSAFAERDPDSALDEKLGELRKKRIVSDGLNFYPDATVIRWTYRGQRGFACARAFPEPNGPLALEVIGTWPAKYDVVMSVDALRLCRETTLSNDDK